VLSELPKWQEPTLIMPYTEQVDKFTMQFFGAGTLIGWVAPNGATRAPQGARVWALRARA